MAEEPFLINPPRKLRRKVKVSSRRKPFVWPYRSKKSGRYVKSYGAMYKNPVGETLVTIGANPMGQKNPWYGDPQGHRIAALMRWGKIPRGRIGRHRSRRRVKGRRRVIHRRVIHRKRGRRWAPKHVRMRRKIAKQAFWTSKYGFMLAHPRSKKVFTRKGFVMAKTRKRSRRKNTWFGQPRRHRRAARKGWRKGHMVPFTHSRRSRRRRVRSFANFFTNPMPTANPRRRKRHSVRGRRRSGSRRRRNPAIMAEFGRFTSGIMDFRGWVPLAITGGFSAITGAVVPGMLGMDALSNPWGRLGVQTAVAIGGGIVVERFVDKRHGQAWMIVGVAMVGYQLLKQFVIVPYFPQFAVGLGTYNDYYPDSSYIDRDQVSQQVGAFPQAVSAYPGVGAFTDEVGAYPYDGSGY